MQLNYSYRFAYFFSISLLEFADEINSFQYFLATNFYKSVPLRGKLYVIDP